MNDVQPRALPPSVQANPRLDDWIRIDPAETITVRTGKVELGQGITTAIAMLAAEELDVRLERIRIETADTARGPSEFMTVGSMSVEMSGAAVRQAAADARQQLLARAARVLDTPVTGLIVEDGVIRALVPRLAATQQSTNYWELMGGASFECPISGVGVPKTPAQRRLVGRRVQRLDMPDLVFGSRQFVHDLRLPGMLYGRVLRPPAPHARLIGIDPEQLAAVRARAGVAAVLVDGSFVGVVAARQELALAACEALRERSQFEEPEALPPMAAVSERLRSDLIGSFPLINGVPTAAPTPPLETPAAASFTLRATYERPYLMHASIGPSAALARYTADGLEVYCSSQGVALLIHAIARVVRLPVDKVRLVHVPGPGCYGHNGSDDAALDAALLARALPGRPVLLGWSRQDEHAFEPFGSAMCVDFQASLDSTGRIIAWNHDVYSYTHVGRAFSGGSAGTLIAAGQLSEPLTAPPPRPMLAPQMGLHRNAEPLYDLPSPRIVKHLAGRAPLRTSSLRSLGAFTNVFAIESAMDELARAAQREPVEFRLAHLSDPRGRAVIEAGAARAQFLHARDRGSESCPRGRGMAYSQYENHKAHAAVFVELEVDLASCAIRLLRAVIAADAGEIVDPDGLENQLEGGFIQAASWTLKEEVTFDTRRITSLDWESYPILTFEEVPPVEVVLLDRPEQRFLGAGEATTGPTPAAIANAVFDACGVRLRRTPFSAARVREALYRD